MKKFRKIIRKNWELYLLLLPTLVWFLLFCYYPMYGAQIAFRDFKVTRGIWGSEWIGLEYFIDFMTSYKFKAVVINTLRISLYSLVVGAPLPLIFALMLHYCRHKRFAKVVQTVSYAPNFISIVILVSLLNLVFRTNNGLVNDIIVALGGEAYNFIASPEAFPHLYVWSGVWQGLGFSAIIYIGALANISPELHEAAIVDGATIRQRIRFVDIPGVMPTFVMLLIMSCGSVMSVGFEKVYLMQNTLNASTAEVISTYNYKIGMINSKYGYSTAVGLFNSVINFILLSIVNTISSKISDYAVF